jgi:serine/threonine protein kinase
MHGAHGHTGKLSEGAESTVFQGSWRGQAVAVKKARIATSNDLDRFKAELVILASLSHPAIVPLLGEALPHSYRVP